MRITRRRRDSGRRHRQGHHSRHHRENRHRRRHRPRHRVRGCGDPRAVDGRPPDRLQHVDRSRRALRHGRARRHDLCLSATAASTRPRARCGSRRWPIGAALPTRRRRALRSRSRARRVEARADGDLGHQPRGSAADRRARARPRAAAPAPTSARTWNRRSLHGSQARHGADRHQDRPRLHRHLHQRPHRRSARRGGRAEGPQDRGQRLGLAGLDARSSARPRPRASTASSRTPASNGAAPAARAARR